MSRRNDKRNGGKARQPQEAKETKEAHQKQGSVNLAMAHWSNA